jgi:RNA polymerase sigma-70 factor (ECF subfamily)
MSSPAEPQLPRLAAGADIAGLARTYTGALRRYFERRLRLVTHMAAAHQHLDECQTEPAVLSPERVVLGREGVVRMVTALQELPERTRQVFMLREFEEMRPPVIAARLGVSLSTVEKEMAKAMAHLLVRVKDYL